MTRCHGIRRNGAAALDLCSVACGRLDGFWELKLKPWDAAAGALVVTEAGGKLSDFSGAALLISGDETLAANAQLHDQMARVASKVKRSHVD